MQGVAGYGATRAGAKYLINNVALAVAPKGVTVNGMGTNFCDYHSLHLAQSAGEATVVFWF